VKAADRFHAPAWERIGRRLASRNGPLSGQGCIPTLERGNDPTPTGLGPISPDSVRSSRAACGICGPPSPSRACRVALGKALPQSATGFATPSLTFGGSARASNAAVGVANPDRLRPDQPGLRQIQPDCLLDPQPAQSVAGLPRRAWESAPTPPRQCRYNKRPTPRLKPRMFR